MNFHKRFLKRVLGEQFLCSAKRSLRSVKLGLTGKAGVLTHGAGRVSTSCQIPSIREIYASMGLRPDHGTFVEIGAYDGETCSNTSFLADQGWRGLYVEPMQGVYWQARLRHMLNNVTVENVAISDRAGKIKLVGMGALSTLSETTASAYHEIPWARDVAAAGTPCTVPVVTLEDVLARNAIPFDFELAVIDVEGHEEPIVRSLLKSRWLPRVLVIELCDMHPDFVPWPDLQISAARVRKAILANGYAQKYADHINSVFLRLLPFDGDRPAGRSIPAAEGLKPLRN